MALGSDYHPEENLFEDPEELEEEPDLDPEEEPDLDPLEQDVQNSLKAVEESTSLGEPLVLDIEGGGKMPSYATDGSAGLDLKVTKREHFEAGERKLVGTGFKMAIPEGYVGLICPRSGLALEKGITVLNAPGVIDSDYRGPVGVILINHSKEVYIAQEGERVAQLLIVPVEQVEVRRVDVLDDTKRGEGGFGSTGH